MDRNPYFWQVDQNGQQLPYIDRLNFSIAQDVESADLSGVSGTPTFFINGQRHYGAYDIDTLTAAINAERQRLAAIT